MKGGVMRSSRAPRAPSLQPGRVLCPGAGAAQEPVITGLLVGAEECASRSMQGEDVRAPPLLGGGLLPRAGRALRARAEDAVGAPCTGAARLRRRAGAVPTLAGVEAEKAQ